MTAQPLGPALDDSGHPLDQVVLTGISAFGYHGVFEHERREGQTFVADVVVHLDTRRAAATDDLLRTVHYGELAERVAGVLGGEPADLVETVAERIAATALADPAVVAVDVAVHKPGAPITVPFEDVVVRIRRDRQKLPAAEPWAGPVAADLDPAEVDPDAGPVALAPGSGTVRSGAGHPAGPDRLDEVPPHPVDAVLALGSNLGAPQHTLRAAVQDVAAIDGVELVAVSPLARTAPVGGPGQPDFLNAVVLVRTTLSARGLLRAAQDVEARHGRERTVRWGPRTLDVDLITYDTTVASAPDLELPHPRAHERAFVLQPWAQVAPDAVLPGLGGGPVAALAATAPDRDGVRWLALDWMTAPVHRPPAREASPDGPSDVRGAGPGPDPDADADAEPDLGPDLEPDPEPDPDADRGPDPELQADGHGDPGADPDPGPAGRPAAPHHAAPGRRPEAGAGRPGGRWRRHAAGPEPDPLGWLPDPGRSSPSPEARPAIFSPVVPPDRQAPRPGDQGP